MNNRVCQFAGGGHRSAWSGRYGHAPSRRLIPALILFLTLAWQSFAIQTHVHPLEATSSAAIRTVSHKITATKGSQGGPATCPICQELTQIGHILSPTLPALHPPTAATAPASEPILDIWTRRARSHGWLSRGPPHRA